MINILFKLSFNFNLGVKFNYMNNLKSMQEKKIKTHYGWQLY